MVNTDAFMRNSVSKNSYLNDLFILEFNPNTSPAEPGYTLPLQTV